MYRKIIKRCFTPRLLGGMVAFSLLMLAPSMLWAQTRSLKIYYIHTKEKAEIVYKKDGRYIDAGLKKLNYLLRDWRRNEPTNMDPRLFDLIWQVYKLSGSRDYIHVVSAYRSPATNNMLRSRSASSGVAKNSQHTLGKALDFYLPDVNLAKLRAVGLKQEGGGVGYYPTSGSPFIHMDVGSVRHWPRMNRKELMALFPDGKTIHVPSDGKPLEGYNQALAAYNARKGSLPPIVVAKEEKKKDKAEKKPLFAGLFGKKKNKNDKKNKDDKKVEESVVVARNNPSVKPAQNISQQDEAIQVLLPDTDAPVPAFSPLKQERDNKKIQEDAIAALLVAQAEIEETAPAQSIETAPVFNSGFLPVPVLEKPTPPSMIAQGQKIGDELAQLAYIPPLSPQNTPAPHQQILPSLAQTSPSRPAVDLSEKPKEETEFVTAKYEDIVGLPERNFSAAGHKILDKKRNENNKLELLAEGMDEVKPALDDREDLLLASSDSHADDFPQLDQDVIRALIIKAMAANETDQQTVASITPRTAPKADKPRLDELAQLIAQDDMQRQSETTTLTEKIQQIPELVFVSGLEKNKKPPAIATLGGRAINFLPLARVSVYD